MVGRSGLCLLVILLLVLTPLLLCGQSDQGVPSAQAAARAVPDPVSRLPLALQPDWAPVTLPPRFPGSPPGGVGFPQFARAAGMIFSGTVTNIERRPATRGQAVETVAITFRVENAIRGATPGEALIISQWMGLWSSGQRYRLGERVLVFLYPSSKVGLTSCVGGLMGRFAIGPWGRVLLTAQYLSAFQRDPVLGGKSRVRFSDLALAVRRASEEE